MIKGILGGIILGVVGSVFSLNPIIIAVGATLGGIAGGIAAYNNETEEFTSTCVKAICTIPKPIDPYYGEILKRQNEDLDRIKRYDVTRSERIKEDSKRSYHK